VRAAPARASAPAAYAELQTVSNFSFGHGASDPEELVLQAASLGLAALGLADHASLAGIVRAHVAARQAGLRLVVGARLDPTDGAALLCYPSDRAAYARLTRLLTLGRRRAGKGSCRLDRADLLAAAEGQNLILLPPERPDAAFAAEAAAWAARAPGRVFLAARARLDGDDRRRIGRLAELAGACGTPLVAVNDVLYHHPARRPLQDVLTALRLGCRVDEAGWRLEANAERHLKAPAEMARLFAPWPEALANSLVIVARSRFSLDELRYAYPAEDPGDGLTPQQRLERLVGEGAARRYPEGVPAKVAAALADELALIGRKDYAPYFLTVHDLVGFARRHGILCQGRGSAANSAVCFCLFITHVDPARFDLLFARFISDARDEPPDIDVDFEHERREEVIQYLYARYGRDHAALTATVIRTRARSALRDVGKALGLSDDVVGALARSRWGSGRELPDPAQVRALGLDPDQPLLARALALAAELIGFPRHLSQHVGGFVICRDRLDELVPIENARMADRTVIEWDKDDIDALGLMKVDVLALGMLSCVRRAFALLEAHHGRAPTLATVPAEDPAVYRMLGRADAIGVFQVESRAQMAMLPRLRPACFYDLVVEVAIVRPGPIQGEMVHPYLRRRAGKEAVEYPSPELRAVLHRTLGVPLFQEQVMRIAIVAAGFTPAEADRLRRSMASFRRTGQVAAFRDKLVAGMVARGYPADFAERVFRQIEGFAEYGFPESHAAAFAQLAYVSAWLKCHYPAAFACALLNSQPMGFYAPAQIVRDAAAHGVAILPADINASAWDCTLEPPGPALRLGLRQIHGLSAAAARRLLHHRAGGYSSPQALAERAALGPEPLEALARADAFASLGLSRRAALWAVRAARADPPPLLAGLEPAEPAAALPEAAPGEEVAADYASLTLSLRDHPLALLRPILTLPGLIPAAALPGRRGRATVAGLVLTRQRPGTAGGVVFLTLEDETAFANIVVWPALFEASRPLVLSARCLAVRGRVQSEDGVTHLIAESLTDLSAELDRLARDGPSLIPVSRDFH
jgi:error-prone DNA polymerase